MDEYKNSTDIETPLNLIHELAVFFYGRVAELVDAPLWPLNRRMPERRDRTAW